MNQKNLTQQQIFEQGWINTPHQAAMLTKPNPPSPEMVDNAQFVDKTYKWKHARIRSGDGRPVQ